MPKYINRFTFQFCSLYDKEVSSTFQPHTTVVKCGGSPQLPSCTSVPSVNQCNLPVSGKQVSSFQEKFKLMLTIATDNNFLVISACWTVCHFKGVHVLISFSLLKPRHGAY